MLRKCVIAATAIVGVSYFAAPVRAAVIPGTSLTPSAWYAADAAGNTTTNDAGTTRVTLLDDLSGDTTSRDAAQATLANAPALVVNAVNGKPALSFDGSDFLSIANGITGDAYTAFAVLRPNAATTARTIISGGDGSFQYRIGGDGNENRQQVLRRGTQAIGASTTNLSSTAFNIADVTVVEGARPTFRLNLAADGTGAGNAGDFGANAVNTVGSGGGTNEAFVGSIAEIVLFNSALSASDVSAVETYLQGKYNVVPEPTGALAGVALAAAALKRRRRQ